VIKVALVSDRIGRLSNGSFEAGSRTSRRRLEAAILSRIRSEVTSRSNWANDRRTLSVKQRGDEARPWFENEGIGYEITQLDDVWGIRVKPFYMFTGRDARKPLPAFARTARSTRMKLDRNKNVEDDLTFWARFLSENKPTINIGQSHVNDLILEGQFFTVELPEQGLLRDDDEDSNRMPA